MLLMSASMKFLQPQPFIEGWAKFGYPPSLAIPIAITEVVCTLLYLIPRTSIFGAILLAAYLGGATASHARIQDTIVGPVGVGIAIWLGLWLRTPLLRNVLPLRS